MPLQGPILAATTFSEAADAALRQAQAIAADLGTPLTVCHVLPEAFRIRVLFPHTAGVDQDAQRALADKAGAALRARITEVIPAAAQSAAIEIESGSAHAGILEIAERVGARLIVLGPGPTAERVARSFTGPVLIARPSPTGGVVLGATDLSDPSLPAVSIAIDEARRRHTKLRLLHCTDIDLTAYVPPATMPGMMYASPVPPALIEQLDADARTRLRAAIDTAHVEADLLIVHGPPGLGIVDTAGEVATALVVVGSRGRGGFARLALGSVAETVMTHARCSVLVVPMHP